MDNKILSGKCKKQKPDSIARDNRTKLLAPKLLSKDAFPCKSSLHD